MVERFSAPVDFNDVDTTNFHLPKVAGNPTAPAIAETWLNTTTKSPMVKVSSSQSLAMARVVTAIVGDGAATSIAVTHNLNTTDVIVNTYTISSGLTITPTSVTRTSANIVTIVYGAAPANLAAKVVVIG